MSNVKRPFIKMPFFLKLNEQKLKYVDLLTYVALKSFDNPEAECFPSHETIAERAGLSRDFIIKSINRLRDAKYIMVWRRAGFQSPNKSYSNHYYFPKITKSDYSFMIPYELLKEPCLTVYEKAMLLCLYQFGVTPFELFGSINTFAKDLGLTYKVVHKQYNSLLNKGYIDDSKLKKNRITQLKIIDLNFTQYLRFNTNKEITLKVA